MTVFGGSFFVCPLLFKSKQRVYCLVWVQDIWNCFIACHGRVQEVWAAYNHFVVYWHWGGGGYSHTTWWSGQQCCDSACAVVVCDESQNHSGIGGWMRGWCGHWCPACEDMDTQPRGVLVCVVSGWCCGAHLKLLNVCPLGRQCHHQVKI